MAKNEKIIEFDIFDLMTGKFEDLEEFEIEETFKTFAEHYEYYNAERDIARKIMKEMLDGTRQSLLESFDESTD